MEKKHKDAIKYFLSLIITLVLLVLLFQKIDIKNIIGHLLNLHPLYFFLSLLMFIPIVLLSSYRWKKLLSMQFDLKTKKSIELFFVATTFNIFIPARMGDFSRSYFLRREKNFNMKKGTAAFLVEKAYDMFALSLLSLIGVMLTYKLNHYSWILPTLLFCVILMVLFSYLIKFENTALFPKLFFFKKDAAKDVKEYVSSLRKEGLVQKIFLLTIVYWLIQLIQAYFFFLSLRVVPNPFIVLSFIPIGIFVGLIPLTIVGMGTRDTVFLILFKKFFEAPLIAGFGILFTLRYLIPGFIGLIWVKKYLVDEGKE